jgi:hypothetical protein
MSVDDPFLMLLQLYNLETPLIANPYQPDDIH